MLAGKLFNIPVRGTHAHAYITSFAGVDELQTLELVEKDSSKLHNLLELSTGWRTQLAPIFQVVGTDASDGELAALISFAIAFPDGFMALVDTYDVKRYHSSMLCTNHSKKPTTLSKWGARASENDNNDAEQTQTQRAKQQKTCANPKSCASSSACYMCNMAGSIPILEENANRPTYLTSERSWR